METVPGSAEMSGAFSESLEFLERELEGPGSVQKGAD